jgi:hypothetical protein
MALPAAETARTLPGVAGVILSLALSPEFESDGICFAAGLEGLYRSEDGGQTWRPAIESERPLSVLAVALSPAFPQDGVLLAGVGDGLCIRRTAAVRGACGA